MVGSLPCFEIWLLFHTCKYNDLSQDEIVSLLENKRISNSRRYIDQFLGIKTGDGYNKSKPRINRFIIDINHAINEAKKIELKGEKHPSKLGSYVYKVVEKLLK